MELSDGRGGRLAQGLGWFSVGLGLAETLAPRRVANVIGVPAAPKPALRALGLREIVSGVGILAGRRLGRWMGARVVGDVIDLALLGVALRSQGFGEGLARKIGQTFNERFRARKLAVRKIEARRSRRRVAIVAAAVIGVTVLDILSARRLRRAKGARRSLEIKRSIVVRRSPEELYRMWKGLEGLPRFMPMLTSVERRGDTLSHWIARGPAGTHVEFDTELIEDEPNRMLSWISVDGSKVEHTGSVRFEPAPGSRGTVVTVQLSYSPPRSALGSTLAELFGEALEKKGPIDLRRFKQLVESGELAPMPTEAQLTGPEMGTPRRHDIPIRG